MVGDKGLMRGPWSREETIGWEGGSHSSRGTGALLLQQIVLR